uniref:Phlebovirus glycoprotein G2 fusion domain-containing protein n=1 Tax=Strongyloides venezuelensis TaxID=75913 RepID=A0A0K0F802_STRVS
MSIEHSHYYWFFPYQDILNFDSGITHKQLSVNVWRIIIISFVELLILLVFMTIWLCHSRKKYKKINDSKKRTINKSYEKLNTSCNCNFENFYNNHHICEQPIENQLYFQNNELVKDLNKPSICESNECMVITNSHNPYIFQCHSNRCKVKCNCKFENFTKRYIKVGNKHCPISSFQRFNCTNEDEICKLKIEEKDSKEIKESEKNFRDAGTSTSDLNCNIENEKAYQK